MYCVNNLCIRIEKVRLPRALQKIETKNAIAICVKLEAVSHWLQLAQALFYAYHWRKPARNPNISALMYLSGRSQIKEALEIVGDLEAICAALGPPEEVEKIEMPRGEPHYPEGGEWDPWKITKFALDVIS